MFDWENAIALDTMQAIGPHLAGRGKSHGFSRVAAGTSGIFSSYSGDVSPDSVNIAQHWAIQNPSDPLPLLLQPRQNQCLNHL